MIDSIFCQPVVERLYKYAGRRNTLRVLSCYKQLQKWRLWVVQRCVIFSSDFAKRMLQRYPQLELCVYISVKNDSEIVRFNREFPARVKTRLSILDGFTAFTSNFIWPHNIVHLIISNKTTSTTFQTIEWPKTLVSLQLNNFDLLDDAAFNRISWPSRLSVLLAFTSTFDKPIDKLRFPDTTVLLDFGDRFNQPLQNVVWPLNLKSLLLSNRYNQSLDNVLWPSNLQRIEFPNGFTRLLKNVQWPESLTSLIIYRHQIDHEFNWPRNVQYVHLQDGLIRLFDTVHWPSTVKHVYISGSFDPHMQTATWPKYLETLEFGFLCWVKLEEINWPKTLQHLILREFHKSAENFNWPPQLKSVSRPPCQDCAPGPCTTFYVN